MTQLGVGFESVAPRSGWGRGDGAAPGNSTSKSFEKSGSCAGVWPTWGMAASGLGRCAMARSRKLIDSGKLLPDFLQLSHRCVGSGDGAPFAPKISKGDGIRVLRLCTKQPIRHSNRKVFESERVARTGARFLKAREVADSHSPPISNLLTVP